MNHIRNESRRAAHGDEFEYRIVVHVGHYRKADEAGVFGQIAVKARAKQGIGKEGVQRLFIERAAPAAEKEVVCKHFEHAFYRLYVYKHEYDRNDGRRRKYA